MRWKRINEYELPTEYKDFLLFDSECHKKRIGLLSGDRWLFDDGTEILVSRKDGMVVTHYSELPDDPK